jgi:hypothetical protein
LTPYQHQYARWLAEEEKRFQGETWGVLEWDPEASDAPWFYFVFAHAHGLPRRRKWNYGKTFKECKLYAQKQGESFERNR